MLRDPVETGENTAFSFQVDLYDLDGDDITVQSVTSTGGAVSYIADGAALQVAAMGHSEGLQISFDPGTAYDYLAVGESTTETVSVTFDDGTGHMVTADYVVTINGENDGPVAADDTNIGAPVVEAGNSGPGNDTATGNVLANDTDVDLSDVLQVTYVDSGTGEPGSAMPVTNFVQVILGRYGALLIGPDGSWTYNLNNADPDTEALASGDLVQEEFTYTVSDGNGGTDTATLVIDISGDDDNSPPVANTDGFTVDEDSNTTFDILGNDTDPENDPIVLTSIDGIAVTAGSVVTLASGATVLVNVDGSVDYAPAPNVSGNDSFSYSISDGNGGSDTGTVNVTVTPVADTPTVSLPAAGSPGAQGTEDTALPVNLAAALVDTDGSESLMLTLSGFPAGATFNLGAASGTDWVIADAQTVDLSTLAMTPPPDWNGSLTLDVVATATETANGDSAMATASTEYYLVPVNDDPVAQDDAATTDEDTPVAGNVLADNGNGPDSDVDGDTLTVSAVESNAGNVGSQFVLASGALLLLNADGSYAYDPNGAFDSLAAGASTTDIFTYEISDGNGGTDTATVTVAIDGVNDEPDAQGYVSLAIEETPVYTTPMINDTDPEGDPLHIVSFTQGAHGTVTYDDNGTPGDLTDDLLVYTGETDFFGTDSFDYTISDGNGGFDTATITMLVQNVNDDPVAVDETIEVALDTPYLGAIGASDADPGDTLSYSEVTAPVNGTLALNPDGTYTYTPDAGYLGLDSFEVEVSDGNGGTDIASIDVEVANESLTTPGGQTIGVSIESDPVGAAPAGNVNIDVSAIIGDNINIAFAFDGSGSLGSTGYQQELTSIQTAINALRAQFAGSATDVDVQLIGFSRYIKTLYIDYGSNGGTPGGSIIYSDAQQGLDLFDPRLDHIDQSGSPFYAFPANQTNYTGTLLEAIDYFSGQPSGEANFLYFMSDGVPYPDTQTYDQDFRIISPLTQLQYIQEDPSTPTIGDGLAFQIQALATVEALAIEPTSGTLDKTALALIDSDATTPADVTTVTSPADLANAITASPLFAAELVDFSLQLIADGAPAGEIADETSPALTTDGLNFDLALANVDGLGGLLGVTNQFLAYATFDLDGDLFTTADQVSLFSTEVISRKAAAQTLVGTDGDDLLLGSVQDDVIDGGLGNDLIVGYEGNDSLTGGAGADGFVFAAGSGDDLVTDFAVGTDVLILQGGITISALTEIDTNADTVNDASQVDLSSGGTILLGGVVGVVDPNDLLT